MAIDWTLLAQVRERQKLAAQEQVARDRQLLHESEQRAAQAQQQLQQQIDAKASLWQAPQGANADAPLGVGQLRQISAWSGALDGHIAAATTLLQHALEGVKQRRDVFETSRRCLRETCAELEKAREMHKRERIEQRRAMEVRREDGTEEGASKVWLAKRGGVWSA